MKKTLSLVLALLFLSGCALSTIKPYKKGVVAKKEPEPVKKSIIERIVKPAEKPAPIVEVEEEEIK